VTNEERDERKIDRLAEAVWEKFRDPDYYGLAVPRGSSLGPPGRAILPAHSKNKNNRENKREQEME